MYMSCTDHNKIHVYMKSEHITHVDPLEEVLGSPVGSDRPAQSVAAVAAPADSFHQPWRHLASVGDGKFPTRCVHVLRTIYQTSEITK